MAHEREDDMRLEKRTFAGKVHLTETEHMDVARYTNVMDRSFSDWVRSLIRRELYGELRRLTPDGEWASSDFVGRCGPERD